MCWLTELEPTTNSVRKHRDYNMVRDVIKKKDIQPETANALKSTEDYVTNKGIFYLPKFVDY